MSESLIVCENCGKKFRLPETYKSPKAKCTQCGSAIDVAGQRAAASAPAPKPAPAPAPAPAPKAEAPKPAPARPAAAKPAAARPATEKPAAEKPAAAERPARRATATASSGATSRRGAKAAEAEGSTGRRGRGEAPAKKNQMPLLLGAGGVVVLGVVGFLLMSGGDKAKPAPAAQPAAAAPAPEAAQQPAAQPSQPAEKPATAQAAPAVATPKPAEPAPAAPAPTAKTEETKPAAEATPTAEATKPAAEEKKPEAKVSADNWMNSKVTSMDQVFDPKKETDEVVWAAYISDADKTEIMALLDIIRDGGVKSAGAKTKLEKMGHKATYGIISRLREIDYKDSFDAMYGWELNKVLETITGGMNVGYAPVLVGEDMDPRKADWNARTAKAWLALPKQFETEEAFEEMVKKRRERSK